MQLAPRETETRMARDTMLPTPAAHRDLRVLVVDDEPVARRRLARLLSAVPGIEVTTCAASGREALAVHGRVPADILVLDLEMPGMTGLELIAALPAERRPVVIVVTAHPDFALTAFDLEVVDYVLKPVSPTRLQRAIQRAIARARVPLAGPHITESEPPMEPSAEFDDGLAMPEGQYVERLLIPTGDRHTLVRVADIDWFEAAGNYVRLHIGRHAATIRRPLAHLGGRLDPRAFRRVHRGIIVQLDRVRQLRNSPNGELTIFLADGTRLAVSRSYRRAFIEALHHR